MQWKESVNEESIAFNPALDQPCPIRTIDAVLGDKTVDSSGK